jgi:hypothetical protein
MERRRIRLLSLLPSLSALLIVNGEAIHARFMALKESVVRFTAGWDALPAMLALGGLYLLAFGLALFYARNLFLFRPSFSLYVANAAIALDCYVLHRPLAVYVAAIIVAAILYREGNLPLRVPLLGGLVVVGFLPIVFFQQPLRFVALAVAGALFFFSFAGVLLNARARVDDFFANFAEHDYAFDSLFYLTVGGFAWAQAIELLGPRAGTACFLAIALVSPAGLPIGFRRRVLAVQKHVAPPPPIESLADFVRVKVLKPSSWVWDDLYDYLSSSPHTEIDEDGETVREAGHLLLGIEVTKTRRDWVSTNKPILFDPRIIAEHIHILGRSGTNKTTLGILPIVTQLIRGYRIEADSENAHQ